MFDCRYCVFTVPQGMLRARHAGYTPTAKAETIATSADPAGRYVNKIRYLGNDKLFTKSGKFVLWCDMSLEPSVTSDLGDEEAK